jgi:hypothetical protein
LIKAQRLLTELLPGQTLYGKLAGAGVPKTFPNTIKAVA